MIICKEINAHVSKNGKGKNKTNHVIPKRKAMRDAYARLYWGEGKILKETKNTKSR